MRWSIPTRLIADLRRWWTTSVVPRSGSGNGVFVIDVTSEARIGIAGIAKDVRNMIDDIERSPAGNKDVLVLPAKIQRFIPMAN